MQMLELTVLISGIQFVKAFKIVIRIFNQFLLIRYLLIEVEEPETAANDIRVKEMYETVMKRFSIALECVSFMKFKILCISF